METSLDKKVTWGYLLKFSYPTIISTLLASVFGIVDGIFVSRFIDHIALSAVGIVMPFIMLAMAVGVMLGTGGNALVAKKIGEGNLKEARENFSLITWVTLITSVIGSMAGLLFPHVVLSALGANEVIYDMAFEYMKPLLIFMPAVMLGSAFQQFLITEGKAYIVTITTVVGGALNVWLNYLLIYQLEMGLSGAAIATCAGYTLPAAAGMIYFTFKRNGSLFFVKPKFDIRALLKSSTNGASEMVTMLSSGVTFVLMNNVLIRIQGEEAVAAASIMFAGTEILTAIFIGYCLGIAPIISYNYGKKDTNNLKKLYSSSLHLMGIIPVISIALGWLLTNPIISIYDVPAGTDFHNMTFAGFRIFILGMGFMGYNTFASVMFTALNNGKVSALLSFFRTLVFVVISFLILQKLFGLTGAWIAMPFAELLAVIMSVYYFQKMKKIYKYA